MQLSSNRITKLTCLLMVSLVGGAGIVNAASPAMPATPDCIFSGNGKISLSGVWQQHPTFQKFNQNTEFTFQGIRSNQYTRIRFTTDFGEAALETSDDTTSASYWYRGTDEILKSSYNGTAYHYGLNPFGYSSYVKHRIKESGKLLPSGNSQEVVYGVAEEHINDGVFTTKYALKTLPDNSTQFRQIDSYVFPKLKLDTTYDSLVIEWSQNQIGMGVPKSQNSTFKYGLRDPIPVIDINMMTEFTALQPIPNDKDIEAIKNDLVKGLFKHDIAPMVRRLPDKNDQIIPNGFKWQSLLVGGGVLLLLYTWFLARRLRK